MFLLLSLVILLVFQEGKTLPDIVPKGSIEAKLGEVVLSSSNGITELDLGTLKTGETYYAYLSLNNLSEEAITLSKIDTSCGS